MNPDKIVIRFDQVAEQTEGHVKRIIGFVRAKNMLQLFDAADLEANPREAKAGAVTADIIESIRETPDTFPFKTKGVLVGASNYTQLQRNRYELRFENTRIEGILDGGHNMLAIGTFILSKALGDDRILRRIKSWSQMKEMWLTCHDEVYGLKRDSDSEDSDLNFLIPLEVLVPSSLDDDDAVTDFTQSILDICAARNNNVELRLETKANQKGYYEELRKALPVDIASRVEWKTNDGGDIKVRDLIALAWIPLSVIDLPTELEHLRVAPASIYAKKGDCVKIFDELMSHATVSKPTGGEYRHELHNTIVGSAFRIAAEIPALYDKIYKDFPHAYKGDGEGRFGRLGIVKLAKDLRTQPTTHFTAEEVEYAYPDGLIMPIVYGLKALMETDHIGHVNWKESPYEFLDECLDAIVKKYRVIMDAFRCDPQKIGKNDGSYSLVIDAFETELLKREAARGVIA